MHNWKWFYSKAMYIWCLASCVWLLLQAIKIYETQEAEGVSLAAFILVLIGNIIWFIYAFWVLSDRNYVIVLNSVINCLMSIVVIVGIVLYQK